MQTDAVALGLGAAVALEIIVQALRVVPLVVGEEFGGVMVGDDHRVAARVLDLMHHLLGGHLGAKAHLRGVRMGFDLPESLHGKLILRCVQK